MGRFTMPSLGADMDAGTLVEWLVKPGDRVHRGDPVAVVDTSKAAIEVECFEDGVVDELLVQEGARVPVGTPLAVIGDGAIPAAPAAPAAPPHAEVHSPLVRRRAEQLGVDLDSVHGTGAGGRITREDVERGEPAHAAAVPPTSPVPAAPVGRRVTPYARRLAGELGIDLADIPDTGRPVSAAEVRRAAHAPESTPSGGETRQQALRATIARAMARSKREIPHYYLTTTVDLQASVAWMQARNAERPMGRRLVPAALLLKATALAAREHPDLNGFWVDDAFVPGDGVHLGVAISLRGGGLVAPAIKDADELALDDLMAELKDLVVRARAGRLRGTELSSPTLTVTNLGDQGVESVLGVIHPPQVAIVGFGRVVDRPVAVGGLLGVRPTTVLSLAADHRATDGFTGARFLAGIDGRLQRPEEL